MLSAKDLHLACMRGCIRDVPAVRLYPLQLRSHCSSNLCTCQPEVCKCKINGFLRPQCLDEEATRINNAFITKLELQICTAVVIFPAGFLCAPTFFQQQNTIGRQAPRTIGAGLAYATTFRTASVFSLPLALVETHDSVGCSVRLSNVIA